MGIEHKIIMGIIMFSMLIFEDLIRHRETKFQTISLMIYIPIELLNTVIPTNVIQYYDISLHMYSKTINLSASVLPLVHTIIS